MLRKYRLPAPNRGELVEEALDEVGRQVSFWLKNLENNGAETLKEMKKWDKIKLRESLDWIQANVPADQRWANLRSVEAAILDELKERRASPPERHYLKFHFGHQDAVHLLLRNVLRDPEVYNKHPDPEVGAAIMVCDKFSPQLQAILCNFAKAAAELDIPKALADTLEDCPCKNALSKPDENAFHEGHLVMVDTRNLKWPYLRTMVQRGRKFRLETDMDTVFNDLRASLNGYAAWCARGNQRRLDKLDEWADAVYDRCRKNWLSRVQEKQTTLKPQGFPGLKQAIREAQELLVFLHDDRAPHGLVLVCKRWYQKEMAKYLSDNAVFETSAKSWDEVRREAIAFNQKWGFKTGDGIVYNYGIWKPLKSRFRYIAGTRAEPPAPAQPDEPRCAKSPGPPRQPLYDAHKTLCRLLQQVEKTLKEVDKDRQASEGIKAFWGIDSIQAFTVMVRTNPTTILENGQQTADFTTMYTSFPFEVIIERVVCSLSEASLEWMKRNPRPEGGMPNVFLSEDGFNWSGEGYTVFQTKGLLVFLMENNYTCLEALSAGKSRGCPWGCLLLLR